MSDRNRVLVVNDEPQVQLFLKGALERRRLAVTAAPHAEAAFAALSVSRFDVILMDVRLPGMNGLDAVDTIQKLDRDTPIIVMASDATLDTALEAVRRGAYDYFTKPIRLDDMEIIVRRALEKAWLVAEVERLREQLAVVVNVADVLALGSFPPPIRLAAPTAGMAERGDSPQDLTLDEKISRLERAFVMDALARACGVQAAAARLLGVTERSVWHLVKKHRIDVSRLKPRRVEA